MIMEQAKYILLLAAGAACLSAGCTAGAGQQRDPAPVPVEVITLEEETASTGRNYVGSVTASRTAVLSCSYPGTLRTLDAKVGRSVRQGDTIAVIVSQNVLSTKKMADATLAQAEDGYRRLSQIYDSGSVAEVKMIEVQTQLSKARAAAQAAQDALDNCTVKAPFSGVIGEAVSEEGVEVNAVEPLVRLMDVSSVEIDFPVPEKEISSVEEGGMAQVEVPALDGLRFSATVKTKGISASALSHSYKCTLSPVEDIPGLMPGMVCKVYMDAPATAGISVPAATVRTDSRGHYVWTVKDSRVEKKYVDLGDFSGKGVEVVSGLRAGDMVITRGAQKVSSGMAVTVK